jgi:hypothetical protein
MSEPMDPELDDVLGDPELIRLAALLSSARAPEPPLDDAFKSGLRRQLMARAWETAEGKNAWWRRVFAPAGLAWVGAATVVVLVASVVLYTANQPAGGLTTTVLAISPQQDSASVPLHQAILVSFNQAMDHGSTERAVQVTPATTVAFRWGGDTQLYVQPTSGNLAPNTQYQVTIGPGAKTQTGTPITTPTTITFVTQPTASPSPLPSPSPKPNALGQLQLTTAYPPSGTTYPVVWSADSSTIYFVGAGGALESVPAKGGAAKTLVPGGASLPAMAPAGDRLAYVRGGKIEILDLAGGTTVDVPVDAPPTTLRWVDDRLYWGTSAAVFRLEASGPSKLADISPLSGAVISIAPDGRHAVAQVTDSLLIVDLASGKTNALCGGGCATTFQAWSPDGSRVVYNNVIADLRGKTITSLAAADVSWSAKNEILLGSDTGLFAVRPDGTGLVPLAAGTFNQPTWAPDSTTFAFVRAGLWVATAPPQPPAPAVTDQAIAVVNLFMDARLHNNTDRATLYLDDAGKAAFNSGNPVLVPSPNAGFKRYYVLTSEVAPSTANSVRVVVRLVFAKGKVEKSELEETLTLKRAQATDPFLIDGATAGSQRDLGKGPEVVAVKVTATEIDVTFDSDLVTTTATGVTLQDSQGMPVTATQTYADRVVTFSGLQLTPGAHYRLVVMPSVQDVGGRHAASEYDLDLLGPASEATSGGVTPTPAPSPSPSPSTSPS